MYTAPCKKYALYNHSDFTNNKSVCLTYRSFFSNPVKYLPVKLVCVIKTGLLKNTTEQK